VSPLPLIETRHLFPEINAALVELLASLDADDWSKPTVHASRDVKDLVAYLLDGTLRRLSFQRDGQFLPAPEMRSFEAMVEFNQRLNREWLQAMRRLSPRVLLDLLRRADAELVEFFAGLSPESPALFGVAWAGEEWSLNWFDVAREYAEKWHVQQQIRDAVDRPGFKDRRVFLPVLDTFLRGAPHAYRHTIADDGTRVDIVISGEAGGTWHLVREADRWELVDHVEKAPAATIELAADDAWKLFTKGLDRELARGRAIVRGDEALATPLFGMVTIMA